MRTDFLELIKTMSCLDGAPVFEDEVRNFVLDWAKERCDEAFIDAGGNIFAFKKGENTPRRPILMRGGLDEYGFMVKEITGDGYLKIKDISGDFDARTCLGKKIRIVGNKTPGILALKAIHLTPRDSRGNVPDIDGLNIDIGAKDKADAETKVKPGDTAVFDIEPRMIGDNLVAKGLRCRIGCAALLKLMEEKLKWDTWFVFARSSLVSSIAEDAAGRRVDPGFAVLADGIKANDLPGVKPEDRTVSIGKGPAIALIGRTVCDITLNREIMNYAKEQNFPCQYAQTDRIRDGGSINSTGSGCRVVSVNVPVRYADAPSNMANVTDIENYYKVIKFAAERAGELV